MGLATVQPRVQSLLSRHGSVQDAIDTEMRRPHPDEAAVARLKKEKLKIKDEIASFG
jgi:hypothetical protein